MSLDAFMKRKTPEKPVKPQPAQPETKPKAERSEEKIPAKTRLEKHVLKCPDPKCKYEKVVVKAKILRNDLTCPKCGTLMKERKQRARGQVTSEDTDEEGEE
jgi:hypothetical protein